MGQTAARHGTVGAAGLACAFAGASLWGLSFVVPLFMTGISAWDVSLGRYLVFGTTGAAFILRARASGRVLTGKQWGKAFVFAATGYYGCYTAMVMAIEAGGAALPTLVMGLTPVSVAVASNLRTREASFLSLAGPLACIGAGLVLVNLARHSQGLGGGNLAVCMAASVAALAMLTYYLVANIEFLIRNPKLSPLTWANATGCALLVFALAALGARMAVAGGFPWEGTPTGAVQYGVCCLILGLAVSWLGGVLWNKANALLPPTLAGQCIVFWPLSGIIYAYVLQRAFPGAREILGMSLVFAGVVWGIRAAGKGSRLGRAAEKK